MKSPFPGMDPYLERHWRDVHTRMTTYSSAQIQKQLGRDLVARIEQRIVVESPPESVRSWTPDLSVIEIPGNADTTKSEGGRMAVADCVVADCGDIEVKQRYIEIRDPSVGGEVVTVVEFLSPSNKLAGKARDQYMQKQEEFRDGGVNLVEIDLVRTGKRVFFRDCAVLPKDWETPYMAGVLRCYRSKPEYRFYRFPLREPMRAIPIPLRDTDEDIYLDLQSIVDQTYEDGRFDLIDYDSPLEPPLSEEDALWTKELLAKR